MKIALLQHVSILSSNLERSTAFYRDVLGMRQVPRPAFNIPGVWLEFGPFQIHLIDNPKGSFRTRTYIDSGDTHFALRVENFEDAILRLKEMGFRADADENDPWRMLVIRGGVAGFPQVYVLDPDNNVIEINATA